MPKTRGASRLTRCPGAQKRPRWAGAFRLAGRGWPPQRPRAIVAIPLTVTHTPRMSLARTRVMSRSSRTVKTTEKIGIEAMMGPTTLTSALRTARL